MLDHTIFVTPALAVCDIGVKISVSQLVHLSIICLSTIYIKMCFFEAGMTVHVKLLHKNWP